MEFSLRPATDADYAWMWALKRATLRGYVEQTWGSWDDPAQERHFRAGFHPGMLSAIVAGGRDVGLLHVERGPTEIFLANIQIQPASQNLGLGSAVVRAVCAEAQVKKIPVRLQVIRVNPARALYERLGFRVVKETATHTHLVWRAD
jgi:ribosomal protein S18 acetylase RimI-like enzyme